MQSTLEDHKLFNCHVKEHLLSDLQGSLAERLGLLVFPAFAVQHGEVVERGGHCGVIFPQSFLSDGQSIIQQMSRLLILVLIPRRTLLVT